MAWSCICPRYWSTVWSRSSLTRTGTVVMVGPVISSRPASEAVRPDKVAAKQISLVEPDARLRMDRMTAQAALAKVAKVNRLEAVHPTLASMVWHDWELALGIYFGHGKVGKCSPSNPSSESFQNSTALSLPKAV